MLPTTGARWWSPRMGRRDLLVSGYFEAGRGTDTIESNARAFGLINASAIAKMRDTGASWDLRADEVTWGYVEVSLREDPLCLSH